MKKREELLKTKTYWLLSIQNDLYAQLEDYMKENNLNRTQLAEKLGYTKGYISQILNGNFNQSLSKLVELSLAIGKVPKIEFENIERFIEKDCKDISLKNDDKYYMIPFTLEIDENLPKPKEKKDKVKIPKENNIISFNHYCTSVAK